MIERGYFGDFGGVYVPEILLPALEELERAYKDAMGDDSFLGELKRLWSQYAGRPTPVYECHNFCEGLPGRIFLKREDLVHGGAHKTNQVLGQALLAKRMGKKRIIAETGAGQHGTATAMMGALFGLETVIYMGAKDVARQQPNVYRMELMGAKVISVASGSCSLKDAINEALRDWAGSYEESHYLLGTVAGPHPFPVMVRDFQKVIGLEAKAQMLELIGRLPAAVIAAVGGGSNAIGIFYEFIPHSEVELIGVEPAGKGAEAGLHGMTLGKGRVGILHGSKTKILQTADGQIQESHSISAGLDYPGVGPEHAHLQATGRAHYESVTDEEALQSFHLLSRSEGIIPALESAHALAYALKMAKVVPEGTPLLVNLSGRGDKDVPTVAALEGFK